MVEQAELSLRDLYVILHRWRGFIVVFTAICVIVALGISLILPKKYTAKATVSLTVLNQTTVSGASLSGQLLANLPSLSALAQGFGDLLSTSALVEKLGAVNPENVYKVKFDEKKGVFSLSAVGDTALDARDKAEKLQKIFRAYFIDSISQTVVTNITALITQSRLDIGNAQESLKRVQQALKDTPQETRTVESILPATIGSGNGAFTAKATSAAYNMLSVQEATLRSNLATSQGRIQVLSRLLSQKLEIENLIGQAIQIQILAPAAEPLTADQPRPLLYAALSGILGLLIALIVPFVAEAVRDPNKQPQSKVSTSSAVKPVSNPH